MIEYNIPECFWELDNTFIENCECSKIFFDVQIDFVDYRLIICKDWYVQKFKSLKFNLDNDVNPEKKYYNNENTHMIQELIIYYIINKYFKTPITDYLGIKKEISHYWEYGTKIGKLFINESVSYVFCDRPVIYRKINIIKFIEFYIFEYKNQNQPYNHNIEITYKDVIKKLLLISEKLLSSSKYSKIRPMIKSLKWYKQEDAETASIDILIEILKQFNKLKIEKL